MKTNDTIKEFQGEYRWLSNFSPCVIVLDGVEYKSVEHAYMSARSDTPGWKEFCKNTESPFTVKNQAKKVSDVEGWSNKKLSVMLECLVQKYNQEPYKTKLIETGDMDIQEGNAWKDVFWGVDLKTGKGKNHLGIMIMNIRRDLQDTQ